MERLGLHENRLEDYARICAKRRFDASAETARRMEIVGKMYLSDTERGIFSIRRLLDMEQVLVSELDPVERPINRKWSWIQSCGRFHSSKTTFCRASISSKRFR